MGAIKLILVGFIVSTLAYFVGDVHGHNHQSKRMKSQAIAHGCAAYDSETGAWGWLPVTREVDE